jgi:branched-chain amino acid aminotransferase
MIGDFVYVNGKYLDKNDAKVSVFDHNFVYGDGVFEGLQLSGGLIFKLREHIDRLFKSCRFLQIDLPFSREEFIHIICETASLNKLRDGYMRPIISRGVGPTGIRNMHQLKGPTVVVIAQHEDINKKAAIFASGYRAIVSSYRRVPPDSLDSRVKTCNYINNILAYLEAKHAGADTAIMLDHTGYLAEGYGSNIFAVTDGIVRTPSEGNILAGITRATLLGACKNLGIEARETRMTLYDLMTADEVFESASMMEIAPIVSITGTRIGGGQVGPITRKLHEALRAEMAKQENGVKVTYR